MKVDDQQEEFQHWLAHMDSALGAFLEIVPPSVRERLDFSQESLPVVEAWLLERYPGTEATLATSEGSVVDGVARYVGETFRRSIGGRWEIRLDNPEYAFHGMPQLTGFSAHPTPVSPHALVTAAVQRRTGRFLGTVLGNYLKDSGIRR